MSTPKLTNHEVSLIFTLRTRTLRNVINNFGQKKNCALGCLTIENQEPWMFCSKTISNKKKQRWYILTCLEAYKKQVQLVKLFSLLETKREALTLS